MEGRGRLAAEQRARLDLESRRSERLGLYYAILHYIISLSLYIYIYIYNIILCDIILYYITLYYIILL